MALMLDDESLHLLGFGSDEILGLEGRARGDDMVGAVSAKIQSNPAFKQALMARLAGRQPLVQSNAPSKKRRQPIGLSYTFTQNGTVNVAVQPQCLFRGEKLICSETTAGSTTINAIFVGNKSQFPTLQNAVPTAAFAGGVLDNEMLLDTCQPAIFIQFQVTCAAAVISVATPQVWTATIFGHAVM